MNLHQEIKLYESLKKGYEKCETIEEQCDFILRAASIEAGNEENYTGIKEEYINNIIVNLNVSDETKLCIELGQ